MAYYRLYHVETDPLCGVSDFEADDDERAAQFAATLNGSSTAELWCGTRKVGQFRPRVPPTTGKG